jgi:uncharacterized protein YutE (UPF0331/DUF86 family)
MGTPPLQEFALRNNGVLQKLGILQYISIDRRRIYQELKGRLDDSDAFIEEIILWMKGNLD